MCIRDGTRPQIASAALASSKRLTAAGRAAAARADEILDEPPAALRDVPDEDVAALLRVLERAAATTPSL